MGSTSGTSAHSGGGARMRCVLEACSQRQQCWHQQEQWHHWPQQQQQDEHAQRNPPCTIHRNSRLVRVCSPGGMATAASRATQGSRGARWFGLAWMLQILLPPLETRGGVRPAPPPPPHHPTHPTTTTTASHAQSASAGSAGSHSRWRSWVRAPIQGGTDSVGTRFNFRLVSCAWWMVGGRAGGAGEGAARVADEGVGEREGRAAVQDRKRCPQAERAPES